MKNRNDILEEFKRKKPKSVLCRTSAVLDWTGISKRDLYKLIECRAIDVAKFDPDGNNYYFTNQVFEVMVNRLSNEVERKGSRYARSA